MKVITVTSDKLIHNTLVLLSAIAVIICFSLMQIKIAYGQESSPSSQVKKFNITFPISTLGNCADLESCKAYCEDPVNKEACVNFAKSKGFYKASSQSEGAARSKLILEKAKLELGCSTEEECKAICQDKTNAEKCAVFAKKYGLGKQVEDAARKLVAEKAKGFLGCNSEEECNAFCKEVKNQEKCSQFAQMARLPGGMIKMASASGKNQEGMEQIKKLIERCKENPDYCQNNMEEIEKEISQKSQEFCKNNPQKCKELESQFLQATISGKVCNEGPGKCKTATGEANLKRRALPPEVRGVSISQSLFQQVLQFFFGK